MSAWDAMCGALLGAPVPELAAPGGRVHSLGDEDQPAPAWNGRAYVPVRRGIPPGWITLNERGDRIGQAHPKSKLTDDQADELVDLHLIEGLSYRQLATRFSVSKPCVRDIIKGRRRAQCIAKVTPPKAPACISA